ncbi:ATP-binding domain-containing protein [Streptomyces sp. NRRL S-495]|uniref:HelD family protein n=1 Tax=Streptomyces sp. NRRL S-495 TaxID=1609133 RepID=UPI00099DE05E|nr:ATP-binding domain-containing protein [Streptomyces sp. NRRL S-495]
MNGLPAVPTSSSDRTLGRTLDRAPDPTADPDGRLAEALRTEQARLTDLYAQLDAARTRALRTLVTLGHEAGPGGTHQARLERELRAAEAVRHAARLDAVERGLCFGRLDHGDGTVRRIGRIGLVDDREGAYEPLLIDWRAPAARPFYTATPVEPGGVVRRRHLRTRGRTLVGLDDEALDLEQLGEHDRRTLVGEAALLAALARERTGRMRTAVATLQAEQDRVIRAPLPGALVVQGGPGTGKTVTALHRAAYLLYTHRAVLERRGILVVGPNPAFLRYIDQVLPALGETEVVLRTVGELFPGVRATVPDTPAAAVVKGGAGMAEVVRRAVEAHQAPPAGEQRFSEHLRLSHRVCAEARDAARGLRLPHNRARAFFLRTVLDALAVEQALALGRPYDEEEARYAPRELWEQPAIRARLDALWPVLTPHQVIDRLLSDPALLAVAAPGLTPAERAAVLRPAGSPWTTGDVPLLDEAAELLGEDAGSARARARAAGRALDEELDYAEGVLTLAGLRDEATDVTLDADLLAERFRDTGPDRTTAERAAEDREWAYGHVVVDEAQELSAMDWRTVLRRVPTHSLTIVGDLAQTGSPAGSRTSWAELLDRELPGRRHEVRLTVNYRTPAAIMAPAAEVLRAHSPGQEPTEAVRETAERPHTVPVPGGDYAAALAALPTGPGTVGVIAPDDRAAALGALTVRDCKGLEFDAVVLVDPAGLLAQGWSDLYVALTRATARLTLLHHTPLPAVLAALEGAATG